MFTILLALIDAKYKHDFEGVYLFTLIIDLLIIEMIGKLIWT